jgi:hypothetical protein
LLQRRGFVEMTVAIDADRMHVGKARGQAVLRGGVFDGRRDCRLAPAQARRVRGHVGRFGG